MPRGGARLGAGRPAGSQNVDTAASRQALADLASGHVEVALQALATVAETGQSEGARVSAACAILDRVYGRPAQAVHHEGGVDTVFDIRRIIITAADDPETMTTTD